MAAGQGPAAEVHAQFVDAAIAVAVADQRNRKTNSPRLAVQAENRLAKATPLADDVLDVLDRGVALPEPRVHFADERRKRPRAPDAPAHGVVQFGLAGKRPDQRIQ